MQTMHVYATLNKCGDGTGHSKGLLPCVRRRKRNSNSNSNSNSKCDSIYPQLLNVYVMKGIYVYVYVCIYIHIYIINIYIYIYIYICIGIVRRKWPNSILLWFEYDKKKKE